MPVLGMVWSCSNMPTDFKRRAEICNEAKRRTKVGWRTRKGGKMISDLVLVSVIFSAILLILMSVGVVTFGKLIAKTPDRDELRGIKKRTEEDKKAWYSPENMPMNFVKVCW